MVYFVLGLFVVGLLAMMAFWWGWLRAGRHPVVVAVDAPRECHKADLPPDVSSAIDSGGSLSNDQMVTLLEATGNEATAAEITETHSHSDGESLTDYERGRVKADRCPDCGHEGFLGGPRGGMARNFKCANEACGSRFNDLGMFGIDRISDPSPDKPPRAGEGAYR